jgi:hypothetical protein
MNFSVLYTENFLKDARRLVKKYASLKNDLQGLIRSLELNPTKGIPLGKNCFKIRLAIASKVKGKSGGARVIVCVLIDDTEVHLLTIFDKSEKDSISDQEIKMLRDQAGI